MKVTIDGVTYEGTEEEIRRIAANPPHLSQFLPPRFIGWKPDIPCTQNKAGEDVTNA